MSLYFFIIDKCTVEGVEPYKFATVLKDPLPEFLGQADEIF